MERFTTAFPIAHLDVLDRLEIGRRRVLFEVRISPPEPQRWIDELRKLRHVRDAELIEATERSSTYRIVFAGPTYLPIVKRLKLIRQFPFPIQNGVATWVVVGEEAKIRVLLQWLERTGTFSEVEAIRRSPFRRVAEHLTVRQQAILREAMRYGYFEVPRRISLTQLAVRVEVATSTLSVTLAVIEKKIVESYVWSRKGAAPMHHGPFPT